MNKRSASSNFSLEKSFKRSFWKFTGPSLENGGSARFDAAKAKSILILRPDRLGDLFLSVPAIQTLQKGLDPSVKLTLVAGDRNAQAAKFFFPNARIWTLRNNIFSRLFLWTRLWMSSFDAVLDLHSYPFSTTSALMSVLSKCPVRVGFWATGDFAEYHELSRKVFNHGVKAPLENISETDKSFLLVKKLVPTLKKPSRMGLPSLPEAVGERVSKFLEGSGITPGDRVVCLHPTLQKRDNRWSPARYLELVSLLSKEPRLKFIVLHGKGESEELSAFRESARPFSNVFIAPSNDLLFILSVAKRSDALVCGDSGLMHACSWVTRVAAVFGPSEPKRWGPSSLTPFRHQVFRKKDRRCDSVPAREVSAQVKKMLAKRSINDPRQVIFHGLIR